MEYLSASRHYGKLADAGVDPEALAQVSIFGARYRFAAAFEGIRADGIRAETVRGYETLMRLLLVQTALEALKKVTGHQVRLVSPGLAARLRADPELVEILLDRQHRHVEYKYKKKQDAAIAALVAEEHSDLYPVIHRARNMFAHGNSTSNRFALDRRKARRQWLNDLADWGLSCADRDYSAWVDRQLRSTSG